MRLALLAALWTLGACGPTLAPAATTLGPFSASSNFSVDLLGPVDTRPACYGNADFWNFAVTFNPPTGMRVRVLRLRGDLVSWPRIAPGELPIGTGKFAGVLLGFQTTAPEGSKSCDWCADNTMLYIQDATDGGPRRAPFNDDVRVGGLLGTDNKLVVKVAAWLNTTGHYIHIEPTFTVVYQYERVN